MCMQQAVLMQLAIVDQGGWIVFRDQMSWSTYGRNSLEKLFDIGKESKYALFEDAYSFAIPNIYVVTYLRHEGKIQIPSLQLYMCSLCIQAVFS